jgi:hypothetical protein
MQIGLRQVLRRPPVWFLVQARRLAMVAIWITRVHVVAFFIVAGIARCWLHRPSVQLG